MNYPPTIDTAKETKKIITFLKKTLKSAGKSQAIVAASGGIDSSTTLVLTAKALGSKNTFALLLPSRQTPEEHTNHALKVSKLAKLPKQNIIQIPISAIIQKTWRIIKHYSPSEALAKEGSINRKYKNAQIANLNRLRLGNIAARTRMMITYDQAKKLGCLVIGTENHSEHLLGYYTRFGDEASDIEPIKHLYKTQLIQLAKHLKIPHEIIIKPPTPGLWQNQTDEAELGFSYNQADPILYLHFDQNKSAKEITKSLKKISKEDAKITEALVTKVLSRTKTQAFKHQLPYHL